MRARDYRNELRKQIKNLRLMDDRFMNVCLKDDVESVQLIVRIILERPDLVVTSVRTQEVMSNLVGRNVEFDISATDGEGKIYDIEIQRENAGAGRKRARYHSSVIDSNELKKGRRFDDLPETFVIFITEHDPLGAGEPIYHIDRRIKETNELFGDEAHIVYVNGSCMDIKTELGKLMFDFSCKDPDRMHYKPLADKVRYFKRNRKGLEIMAGTLDQWAKEITDEAREEGLEEGIEKGIEKGIERGRKKGIKENKVEVALKLIQRGGMAVEEIADLLGLSVKSVQKLAAQKAA